MEIVRADNRHTEGWLGLRLLLWPECPPAQSAAEIETVLDDARQTAFVAVNDDGAVVGFVEVSTRDYVGGCSSSPVGYIEGIYLMPEYRHKGIGTGLIRETEHWTQMNGYTEIGSDTRVDDTRSMAFHTAVGFRETDRQVVFLKGIVENSTNSADT